VNLNPRVESHRRALTKRRYPNTRLRPSTACGLRSDLPSTEAPGHGGGPTAMPQRRPLGNRKPLLPILAMGAGIGSANPTSGGRGANAPGQRGQAPDKLSRGTERRLPTKTTAVGTLEQSRAAHGTSPSTHCDGWSELANPLNAYDRPKQPRIKLLRCCRTDARKRCFNCPDPAQGGKRVNEPSTSGSVSCPARASRQEPTPNSLWPPTGRKLGKWGPLRRSFPSP
jgi:hypothetical protein